MALRLSFLKAKEIVIFNRSSWCIRRALLTSVVLKKKKNETIKSQNNLVNTKSRWKQVEAISIWKEMTLKELADALQKDVDHVLEVMTFIDDTYKYKRSKDVIDNFKVIQEVVKKSGKRVKITAKPEENEKEEVFVDATRRNPSEYIDVKKRFPIVTIMGHVDHGKTTLLDTLRKSTIVDSEFGGITQHIGAFKVTLGKDTITFLDTPGHAAFFSMRNRGAQCTDIVVLVVAADDGVMEQTVESINMAKAAGVPIVVAINKIDKPKADVERTKRMLVQQGVQVEDHGGDVQVVNVSALKGTNIDSLIEAILAEAEILELKSDFSGPVEGIVLESCTDPLRGKLSTLLVQCGTLKKGSILVAGTVWCRVRAMFDDNGDPVQIAKPSSPVQILGWKELPSAGDVAIQVTSEKKALNVINHREKLISLKKMEKDKEIIDKKVQEYEVQYKSMLEEKRRLGRYKAPRTARQKEIKDDHTGPRLNVIIKGDVDGSVEAILDVLETYESTKCKLDVVHYGVGPVSQNDATLAELFSAKIYAFNTLVMKDVSSSSIKHFNVIYRLVDDLKSEISKLLPHKDVEEIIGEANVLQEFLINEGKSKVPVAGCRCVKGSLKKSAQFKLVRSNDTLFCGSLISIRHLKDEVDTVKKDVECGIRLSDPNVHVQPGDTIICFKIHKVPETIDWDPGF
ncbi:mitochondrial translation initiation factor 2 [Rhodnius prolixus]|uniref:mitochondrial translation initiation factor 2 n=1 Tax=Rhodnius prolixus TaxID=13249 RepID=UPI003D18F9B1